MPSAPPTIATKSLIGAKIHREIARSVLYFGTGEKLGDIDECSLAGTHQKINPSETETVVAEGRNDWPGRNQNVFFDNFEDTGKGELNAYRWYNDDEKYKPHKLESHLFRLGKRDSLWPRLVVSQQGYRYLSFILMLLRHVGALLTQIIVLLIILLKHGGLFIHGIFRLRVDLYGFMVSCSDGLAFPVTVKNPS